MFILAVKLEDDEVDERQVRESQGEKGGRWGLYVEYVRGSCGLQMGEHCARHTDGHGIYRLI